MHTVRCISVDAHRCWAGSYVFRGHCIDKSSSDDRQPDEHTSRHIFMHTNAFDSVHASAHECTQFGAYLLDPIDSELDYTYFDILTVRKVDLVL